MDDPLVRTADAIFTDSVNLSRWLREAEGRLYEQTAPSSEIADFAERSIRLELCYAELRSFDRDGTFLGRHPFISQRSERERVAALLKEDPVEFTREMDRVRMNISRYSSQINSAKTTKEKKTLAQANLDKFKAALTMYEEILKTQIHG